MVTYTHLKFPFKRALHFSTLAIKLFNSGTKFHNYERNTMNQSPFKCFATLTTHQLIKLMRFVLLVMMDG